MGRAVEPLDHPDPIMLSFVGLGLYDEHSITIAGRNAIADADRVFVEFYTSALSGATIDDLAAYHDVDIEELNRDQVEGDPGQILDAAEADAVVFLVAGDPMIATTHVDLRLRAHDRGIDTTIIHGVSAQTAASSLTGLQNYRFGKATTLPFEYAGTIPESVIDTIDANRNRGLHTIVYLDIRAERGDYLTADQAASRLTDTYDDLFAVAIAQAGSPTPTVAANRVSALATSSFGDPLHLLVIPGDLHHIEADALRAFAHAPDGLVTGVRDE